MREPSTSPRERGTRCPSCDGADAERFFALERGASGLGRDLEHPCAHHAMLPGGRPRSCCVRWRMPLACPRIAAETAKAAARGGDGEREWAEGAGGRGHPLPQRRAASKKRIGWSGGNRAQHTALVLRERTMIHVQVFHVVGSDPNVKECIYIEMGNTHYALGP